MRHGNEAPRIIWAIPMAPDATPARIHRTPTEVAIVNASPPCVTSQNENVAATSIETGREREADEAQGRDDGAPDAGGAQGASIRLAELGGDRDDGRVRGGHTGDPSSSLRAGIR